MPRPSVAPSGGRRAVTKQQLSAWLELCFERALDARDAADATDGARRMLESLGDVCELAAAGVGTRSTCRHCWRRSTRTWQLESAGCRWRSGKQPTGATSSRRRNQSPSG